LLGLLIYITGLKIALFDRISWWIELEPLARWTQRKGQPKLKSVSSQRNASVRMR